MSVLLSAANTMASSVLSSNDALTLQTESRIATGSEVNSALDDPVRYFRSLDLTRRAAKLTDVSKGIDLAQTVVKAADAAMSAIRTQLDSTAKAMNEARGTAQGGASASPLAITGKTFLTSNQAGVSRVAATSLFNTTGVNADIQQTGKSIADTVRSKFFFDTNGAASNGTTSLYDGNLGIAVPGAGTASQSVGLQINVNGTNYTFETAAVGTDGKDLTVGKFIDALNAKIQSDSSFSALNAIGMKFDIGFDGKMRMSTTAAAATNIKLNFATGTTGSIAYPTGASGGSNNSILGWQATDFSTGITGLTGQSAYDASMIGTSTDTFQDGDAFTISTTDKTGAKQSFTFQASATKTTNIAGAGSSTSNPWKFTSVGDLLDGINQTFGQLGAGSRITADAVNTGGFAARFTLGDAGTSLQIQQTVNADPSATSATNNGITTKTSSANLLNTIFGGAPASVQTMLDTPVIIDASNRTQMQYQSLNYSAPGAGLPDPKRRAAQEAWQAAMAMIDRYISDSKLTTGGQPNLLNGETLRVALGDSSTYTVTLNRLDRQTLGLAPSSSPTFSTDTDIDTYGAVISSAITTVSTQQAVLAQNSSALNGYQSFVNSLATMNSTYSDNLTRADTDTESNRLKALQTMQQMVQAMMSINNTMDSGSSRLLY